MHTAIADLEQAQIRADIALMREAVMRALDHGD